MATRFMLNFGECPMCLSIAFATLGLVTFSFVFGLELLVDSRVLTKARV